MYLFMLSSSRTVCTQASEDKLFILSVWNSRVTAVTVVFDWCKASEAIIVCYVTNARWLSVYCLRGGRLSYIGTPAETPCSVCVTPPCTWTHFCASTHTHTHNISVIGEGVRELVASHGAVLSSSSISFLFFLFLWYRFIFFLTGQVKQICKMTLS